MGEILDKIKGFYQSDDFGGFYTTKYRLSQIKKALKDKRTSAAERLQWVKYLDAHVGDIPAQGPDSGKTINEVLLKVEFVKAADVPNDPTT